MLKTYKALVDFNHENDAYVAGETYELSEEVVATLPEGTVEEVVAPGAGEATPEGTATAPADEVPADAPASEEAPAA